MKTSERLGIDALVERRIQAAMARGEFDNLPGTGRPLALDDDPLVPASVRAAYRVLKNAGFVPPELAQIAEVNALLGAIARAEPRDDELGARGRRLRALLIQLELAGRGATAQAAWQQYAEALRRRCEPAAPCRSRQRGLAGAATMPDRSHRF